MVADIKRDQKMLQKTKSGKWRMLAIVAGSCAALIVAALLCYVFLFNPQRTFKITESYRVTSEANSETILQVCLPISSGNQEIFDLLVVGVDDYTLETYDGWMELTAKLPTDGSEALVTISYSVTLMRNAPPWNGPVLDEYLLPQQFVDSDNRAIIELAEQFRGDSDYKTAQNILNYVHKTIKNPTGSRENIAQLSASELLDNPVGVCGDNAILMTALLRAEGIPARKIDGLSLMLPLSKASDWNHPGIAHAWVEFYIDGSWHFADPTWGLFYKSDTAHLSFGTYESNIESTFQQNCFDAIESSGYSLAGAMSAPLKFMVYSTDENATVVPRADASYSWFM